MKWELKSNNAENYYKEYKKDKKGYDKCITALKLLSKDMEKTRGKISLQDFAITHNSNPQRTYILGWDACLDHLSELINEMIGEEYEVHGN